jgi:hypothetical protein
MASPLYSNGQDSTFPASCLRPQLFLNRGAPTTSCPFTPPPAKIANRLTLTAPPTAGRRANFFEEFGVWKDAPVLTGSTKYEPLPDVKNIMITGGAGFMYVLSPPALWTVPLLRAIATASRRADPFYAPLTSIDAQSFIVMSTMQMLTVSPFQCLLARAPPHPHLPQRLQHCLL